MIGLLRGRILSKQPPRLLIDVHGVGYEVDAPMTTFYDLPATGEEVTLYTHLAVREDAHTLYGFARAGDRELFRSLLKVNGVGARLALTILSGMEPAEFVRCVQEDNSAALVRLPGVGKKTAERLLVEMRDKFDKIGIPPATGVVAPAGMAPVTADQDAVAALIALGYKPPEASRMVSSVFAEGMETEAIIKAALKGTVS